jgi:hypothetical protein
MSQRLIFVNVPDGSEKDALIRRLTAASSREEVADIATKARDFWAANKDEAEPPPQ